MIIWQLSDSGALAETLGVMPWLEDFKATRLEMESELRVGLEAMEKKIAEKTDQEIKIVAFLSDELNPTFHFQAWVGTELKFESDKYERVCLAFSGSDPLYMIQDQQEYKDSQREDEWGRRIDTGTFSISIFAEYFEAIFPDLFEKAILNGSTAWPQPESLPYWAE